MGIMTLEGIHGGAKESLRDKFNSGFASNKQLGVRDTGWGALFEPPTSTLAGVG